MSSYPYLYHCRLTHKPPVWARWTPDLINLESEKVHFGHSWRPLPSWVRNKRFPRVSVLSTGHFSTCLSPTSYRVYHFPNVPQSRIQASNTWTFGGHYPNHSVPSFRHLIVIYDWIYYKWQGFLPSTSNWATYGHVLYLSGLHFFFNITNIILIVGKFLISGDVASNTEKGLKGCWLTGGVAVSKVSLMWMYQKMGLSFLPIAAF